jgi:hypothetical protein
MAEKINLIARKCLLSSFRNIIFIVFVTGVSRLLSVENFWQMQVAKEIIMQYVKIIRLNVVGPPSEIIHVNF